MSTTTPARDRTIAQHALAAGERRRRRWASTWRAALRLAWRDALRHRAATALILAMVGLPVLLITGAATYVSTSDVTPTESVPVALGRAQAKLFDGSGGPVTQNPDGRQWSSGPNDEAATVPGHATGEPWTTTQLAGLTGGAVVPVGYPRLLVTTAAGPQRIRAMAVETSALPATGLARLESGRWPATEAEVAVTATGVSAGLPRSGSVDLRGAGRRSTVQVVGVVAAVDPGFAPVQLVGGSSWIEPGTWYGSEQAKGFLLLRDTPVGWDEVQRLNRYGMLVLSRAVVADPPSSWDRSETGGAGEDYGTAIVVLVCAALVLETTLLAGPAFAVSASRRRRSLALLAGNGADRGQLVRFVCAQGLALGSLAAAAGLGLGLLGGWAVTRALVVVDPTDPTPPFGTAAGFVAAVTVAAVVAATVAAAVPARGAVRLALHPRTRSTAAPDGAPPRLPIALGALGVGIGAAGVTVAYSRLTDTLQVFALGVATGVAVLGVLLLLPALLAGLGRLAGRLPMVLRLGVRDAGRERGRSGPAVAAVLVATSVLTILATSIGSTEARDARDHTPVAPAGHGVIWNGGAEPGPTTEALADRVRRLHPEWSVSPQGTLGGPEYREGTGTGRAAAIVPPGCTAAVAVADPYLAEAGSEAAGCQRASSAVAGVAVVDTATLTGWAPLTAPEQTVLGRGGLLVTDPTLLRGEQVQVAAATFRRPAGDDRRVTQVVRLPALVVPQERLNALLGSDPRNGYPAGAVLLPTAAAAAGLPVTVDRYDVIDPGGPISVADQDEINAQLADDGTGTELTVERGFTSSGATLLAVLTGVAVALVLFATLMSVALTHVERRADLATLAAVGATAAFRRRLAGGHAVVLAGLGVGLGVLVGLVPGVLYARVLTVDHLARDGVAPRPPVLEVPWMLLAAVLLGVPLLAAALATLLVRPAPVLTRRLT